jgi:hypothetical protein
MMSGGNIEDQESIPVVVDHLLDHSFDTDYNILASILWTDHVNIWYQLKNEETRSRFTQFYEMQTTSWYPWIVSFLCIIALIGHSFLLHLDINSNNSSESRWIALDVIIIVVTIIGCFIAMAAVWVDRVVRQKMSNKESFTEERSWRRNITYILFTMLGMYINLYAIRRSFGFVCDNDMHTDNDTGTETDRLMMREDQRVVNSIFCGSENHDHHQDAHHLPVEVIISLFIWPLTIITASPSISIYFVWSHVLVCMTNFVILMSIKDQIPSLYLLFLWILVSIFLIITIQSKNISTYLFHWKLKEMLKDNERLAEEFHMSEMRYVIANMAHDLKTVSTLFSPFVSSFHSVRLTLCFVLFCFFWHSR